ncbi:MAG: extracellular solute-binding protein [Spirochaetales bacterium]|nr:MAG: extracellular solute-binding protein [Spirochaetales bacterium]
MKKTLLVMFVFLILLTGLYAAGKQESGTQPAGKKDTLSIICFQGYAEDAWVKPFEEKYNCTVKITYAGTVEEHFTKVMAATSEYNIVSIDSGRVKMYYDAGLIQPIDTSKLANYGKIGKFFADHPYGQFIPGQKMHIPIVWGTQTITVNMDKVGDKIAKYVKGRTISLDVLTAPEFKGQTAFFDESANVVSIAAIHSGIKTPFNFAAGDWDKVEAKLKAWKNNARTFTTGLDSEFSVLAGGDAYIVLGGNDAPLNLKLEEAGLRKSFKQFAMTEGTITWIDGWVITKPTTGRSYELALAYMDYMIGAQGQKELANLVGFGIVNPEGSSGFNPVVLDSTFWYGEDISKFPAPLYIMIPEDDPGKRIELWMNKVKASQ